MITTNLAPILEKQPDNARYKIGQNVHIECYEDCPFIIRDVRRNNYHLDWEYQCQSSMGSICWLLEFNLRPFKVHKDVLKQWIRGA
jgi:hypothetical protein